MSAGWPAPREVESRGVEKSRSRGEGRAGCRGGACNLQWVACHAITLSLITHHPVTLALAAPMARDRPGIPRRGPGSGVRMVALSRGRCRSAGWGYSRLQHLALG